MPIIEKEYTMKTFKPVLIFMLIFLFPFSIPCQTSGESESSVYAPFVSRLTAESRGTGILLSWKDARNLKDPTYHIYESGTPIDPDQFIYTNEIGAVQSGKEIYLYEPGDSNPRYFIVLAEEEGKIFDLFIPYRNMTMSGVSAERKVLQEEKAARISSLQAVAKAQEILISAHTTDSSRPVILFRSTDALVTRKDLADATRIKIFTNETIELRDHVVPGIPFYYALVDEKLYESGSSVLLYEGSVTEKPVTISLEEWSPEKAHTFQYASKHVPLPLLNIQLDIETGKKLPDPGMPVSSVDLTPGTAQALADLNLGKSMTPSVWRQPYLLPVDRTGEALETSWVKDLIESGDWKTLADKSEQQLKESFDSEIRSRLHFYNGEAHYFSGDLEFAFMEFLSAREGYYKESNDWMISIYKQRRILSKSQDLE